MAPRHVIFFLAIASAFSVCGCSDPAFQAMMTARLGRIKTIERKAWELERKRPENLKQVVQTIRATQALYHRRLVDTVELIDRECAEDFQDWLANGPRRVSRLARLWDGNPEKIAPTYRDLVY